MNDLAAASRLSPDALAANARDLRGRQFALESVWALECAEGLLLVHDFFRPEDAARASATALIPHGDTAPSIAHIFPGAAWHERETADMLALAFAPMDCLPLLLDPATAPGVLSRPPADRPSLADLGLAPEAGPDGEPRTDDSTEAGHG